MHTLIVVIKEGLGDLFLVPHKKHTGIYFVTCIAAMQVGALSMLGYVSAFDKFTWLLIGLSSLITSTIFIRVLQRQKFSDAIVLSLFSLLEQGFIERTPKKFRWIVGVWGLSSIVLSNIYKGDNITSLVAPLPRHKLEHFQQLISRNFSYYMKLNTEEAANYINNINKYWEASNSSAFNLERHR